MARSQTLCLFVIAIMILLTIYVIPFRKMIARTRDIVKTGARRIVHRTPFPLLIFASDLSKRIKCTKVFSTTADWSWTIVNSLRLCFHIAVSLLLRCHSFLLICEVSICAYSTRNCGDKAVICQATNCSEIAGCSHARFAVAVKSLFNRSSWRAIKSRGVRLRHMLKICTPFFAF